MTERAVPHITHLFTHPVKGMRAVELRRARTWITGIEHDRKFVPVVMRDGEAVPLTQRESPKLATFAVGLTDLDTTITALSGEQHSIGHDHPPEGKPERVILFDKPGTAAEVSAATSEFITDELNVGEAVRLMQTVDLRVVKESTQSDDPGAYNVMGYADGYPILMTSESSLVQVNEWVVDLGGDPVNMERFRPNIVVDSFYDNNGDPIAFAEDYLRQISLGTRMGMRAVRACARCIIPITNQHTGEIDAKTLNSALAKHRRGVDLTNGKNGRFFGVNMVHNRAGVEIVVGDKFTDVDMNDEPNIRLAA